MRLFVLKGEYDVYDLTTGMKMYSFQKPDHLAPSIVNTLLVLSPKY